jgi:Ca2+-binding EF-hand superfamily protein
LKAVFDEYLEISKAELEEIMAECDKNGTGSISFKEFEKLYKA